MDEQSLGASAKADRAAGLRPQPAAQSSQSSIPSADALTPNSFITMLVDHNRIVSLDFHAKYPFFALDAASIRRAGDTPHEVTMRLFRLYAQAIEAKPPQ